MRNILPSVPESELHYLLTLLDPTGDESLTFEEFVAIVKDCINLTVTIRGCKAALSEPLQPLAYAMQKFPEVTPFSSSAT